MKLLVENLSVTRGARLIIKQLTFEVAAGDALMVRGANGSGKTTLLRTLAGFLSAYEGKVTLSGFGEFSEDAVLADACHYVGHLNATKANQTVLENINFFARFLDPNATASERVHRIAQALEQCDLTNLRSVPCGYLSAGQKRRLGLSRLLCAYRPIWLLDEPTTSLDQASARRISQVMSDHAANGGIIIAATHLDLNIAQQRAMNLDDQAGVP